MSLLRLAPALLALCVWLPAVSAGADPQADLDESFENQNFGEQAIPGSAEPFIEGEAGKWFVDEVVCGTSQSAAFVFSPASVPDPENNAHSVEILAQAPDSVCLDTVTFTLEERGDKNVGFARAIAPGTSLAFREKGQLFDFFCSSPSCPWDVTLTLRDNRSNTVVYVLQRLQAEQPVALDHSRSILLDPDAAVYQRDLFADFAALPGFEPDGATLKSIEWAVRGRGEANVDEIRVESLRPLRRAAIILDDHEQIRALGGDRLDPSFPTVVMTQGWMRSGVPTDPMRLFYLRLRAEVEAQARIDSGQLRGVNLVTFQWAGAYTQISWAIPPSLDDRARAERAALGAGLELGAELRALLGTTHGPLHMIGDNFGALVNAIAVSSTSPPLSVDQFTALDAPQREEMFDLLLPRGDVGYFDNFFANSSFSLDSLFGGAIRGAAPDGGATIGYSQEILDSQYGSDFVNSGVSAALRPSTFARRAAPKVWAPPVLPADLSPTPLNDPDAWQTAAANQLTAAQGGMLLVQGDGDAPQFDWTAAMEQAVSPGRHRRVLQFEARFIAPEVSDELEVWFGDQPLASLTSRAAGSELVTVTVPLGDFTGQTGPLQIRLVTQHGDRGPSQAQLFLAHFRMAGSPVSAPAAKCGATQLTAESGLLAAELRCASAYAGNPAKDPGQQKRASCETRARAAFAKRWSKALAAGQCAVQTPGAEVAADLDGLAIELFDFAMQGANGDDVRDRAVRSAELAQTGRFCSASLSGYAKNLVKAHASALAAASGMASQAMLARVGAAISKAGAKGLSYAGPSAQDLLAASDDAVKAVVDATTP